MPNQLIYDDGCAFCRMQMRWMQKLDWLDSIRFTPVSAAHGLNLPACYTRERLLQAIHCITPGGQVVSGTRAFRAVGMRVPLLVPIALLLWIPGAIHPAERLYGWIARNRHRFFASDG